MDGCDSSGHIPTPSPFWGIPAASLGGRQGVSSRTGESQGERRIFSEAPGRASQPCRSHPPTPPPPLPQATGKCDMDSSCCHSHGSFLFWSPVLQPSWVLQEVRCHAQAFSSCFSEAFAPRSPARRSAEASLLNGGKGGPFSQVTGPGCGRLLPLVKYHAYFGRLSKGGSIHTACPAL